MEDLSGRDDSVTGQTCPDEGIKGAYTFTLQVVTRRQQAQGSQLMILAVTSTEGKLKRSSSHSLQSVTATLTTSPISCQRR